MQSNEITIAVDTANTGTTTDLVLSRYDEYPTRTVYCAEDHNWSVKDLVTLYRTFPKTSGNSHGTAKSAVKFVKDHTVLGLDGLAQLQASAYVEVRFSFPVGMTTAEMVEMRQRAVALLDNDTVMDKLNEGLDI